MTSWEDGWKKYFHGILTIEDEEEIYIKDNMEESVEQDERKEDQVLEALKKLKRGRAAEDDGIATEIITDDFNTTGIRSFHGIKCSAISGIRDLPSESEDSELSDEEPLETRTPNSNDVSDDDYDTEDARLFPQQSQKI
ncbi:hypothetical protein FQA39_LY06992 [Lamprigera yunnana]|nr:hypothetical protein FQA39_LY06992 [Lamprigera yunnana]